MKFRISNLGLLKRRKSGLVVEIHGTLKLLFKKIEFILIIDVIDEPGRNHNLSMNSKAQRMTRRKVIIRKKVY